MPKVGNVNIGFVTPGADGGTYDGRSTGGGYTAGPLTTVLTTKASNTTTCALYCHGYGLPQWTTTAGTVTCGACHGQPGSYPDARAGAPTGVASSKDLSGALTGFKVGKHANHLDDSLTATGDACALCHNGFAYSDATHVNGTVNISLNAAAGGSATYTPGSPGTCSNLTCHGTADWNSAATGGCDFCHGYPPTSVNAKHASGVTAVNHDKLSPTGVPDNHDQCSYCHGVKDSGTGTMVAMATSVLGGNYLYVEATDHQDGKVTMNGNATAGADAGYNTTNAGCDTAACHVNNAAHQLTTGGAANVQLRDFGPGSCGACHTSGTGGAPIVTATSTHVFANGSSYGDCTDCHNGHANGVAGVNDVEIPTVYTGTTAVPTMTKADGTTALYSLHNYKIQLGGTATTAYAKSTEAEICWACHDARSVSEWGTNTNTDTGSIAYNYGGLYTDTTGIPGTTTSNWTTGYWRSGKGLNSTLTTNPYWYKRGKVRSTHSANYDGTTAANDTGKTWKATLTTGVAGYDTANYNKDENLDAVANIRCTYCHDVHGTHNGIKGDNSSTTALSGPYLRGTWLGNPYPEDGAPRYGMANYTIQSTNGTSTAYGIVPRASAANTNTGITAVAQVGGWWIDQTSNNPVANHGTAAFRTATGNAGLCDQCHGTTKDGTWSAAEIGAIDQVTGENLWVSGYNGHANSVVGGVGPGTAASAENRARNIFTRTLRGSATLSKADPSAMVDIGLATHPTSTSRGFSYRSNSSDGTYEWNPPTGANSTLATATQLRSTAFQTFAWNTTISTASTRNSTIATCTAQLTFQSNTAGTEAAHDAQANYHTFSCSKCHNPHASRLPKLMITNCLDTNHNTWEDNSTFTGAALPTPWTGLRHSQWASAQNCHRLDARATADGTTITVGKGWNTVTPWIEDTTPNATLTGDITTQLTY
ncbi:MAG TPA: hypothetical protein DEB35_00140 [Desulfuromonas sp.]|nr:hypothetical protein [Desulfuromonas sp.]